MSLTKEVKLEIVEKHGRGPADTGSAEVQVALLTRRINDLTEHLRGSKWRRLACAYGRCAGREMAAHTAQHRADETVVQRR